MDRKTELPIAMASSPEIRITAIAPAPDGVASATIESFGIIFYLKFYAKVSKIEEGTR
ncbi:hypothetical protein D3C85_900900 [compost metagenome]